MADSTIHQLSVSLPGAGKVQTYHLDADTPVKFDFDLADAVFTGENGNLEITVEGGGTIVLENYEALADSGHLPLFEMANGERVAGDVYLFAFDGTDQNADLETAAANATSGSGAGQYNDDPGTLAAGITALGGQGDAYGTHAFPTLSGTLGRFAPEANDDAASVTEQGDPDFIVGRHLVFVDDPQQYGEAVHLLSDGQGPAVGEFFPLSTGGGFYINYPNPPQTDETIRGNVIDNDADPDGPQSQLSMYTMDYDGVNHNGVDPAAVQIVSDDTVIVGRYGVLVVDVDGHWEYTLNQSWADVLNEGESFDEIFRYNITDGDGLVSNTATLTITVNGANDMPVAHDDLNVQAVEGGDSTDYGLHAAVYDADLHGDTGGEVTVHDSAHHDYTLDGSVIVHGNVLSGDDVGSVADTDVDGGDSPDGQTMFVVGVYSHATETVDYVRPDEQNPDFTPSGDQAYDQAHVDPSASVTVNGEFGVLTIHADGSYDYRLYTADDGEAYNALNALNYGSENNVDAFSYGIMDDSGAFSYANLSFTVNGANDAPVANADQNNVAEFGLKFAGDADYSAVVSGNVISGDAHGGVADTDVDDTRMFVSTVSSQTDHSGTLYTDADMDPNGSVTIDGEYGTLTIHADGSYDYTLQNGWDNVQALNEGDERTDVFTYTLTNAYDDGVYSEPATLTIHVSGSNDAPVAADDTGTAKEAGFYTDGYDASGNVILGHDYLGGLINVGGDSDVDDATLTVTHVVADDNTGSEADVGGATAVAGKYGTLYIEADGSYHYEVDNDSQIVNELNILDHPTDSFTYTVSDGRGGTDTATLEITVRGSDDAPTAVDDSNGGVVEAGAAGDGDRFAHGFVLANDHDVDNSFIFMAKAGAGAEGSETGGQVLAHPGGWSSVEGRYGTLYFRPSGEYRYVLDNDDPDTQALAEGQVVHDEFNYTASDLLLATDTATLSIEITGSNDAASITGDSTGAVTEDVDVSAAGLLTDSGRLFAADADNPDDLFRAETITDSQGGTFHINTDGTWTYEIDNGSVQHLGEVAGVNSGFSNDFTVHSADGTEHTVTVSVGGDNDAPLGADFSVHGNAYGEPVHIDFDQAPVTDVEDDYSTGDGLDTGVVITGLPDHGTLYYGDHEVTQADIDNNVRFDDLDNFTYQGDAPASQGVLLGSRLAEDAGLDTWGERVDNATRVLSVDSDGDGATDVTVTTRISSGRLKVYADQQDHIDHGLANPSHNGLDSGETLTMTFDGKDVSYAEIGFGGLGSYFDQGSAQDGQATWAVYDDGLLVASGTVNNSVMTWTNAITGQSGTITGGDGDTFQPLVLDQTILGGESFDRIVFGTTEDGPRDWNANWELQYVDVEFAGTDAFTYQPVDSEGLTSVDDYTVTVDVLPGQVNEDPAAVNDAASVHEPNTDGLVHSVSANVLANDVDADNTPGEMSVTKVTFGDTTVDFANHSISGDHAAWGADGTATIEGAHGYLTIGADGGYTYTATDDTLRPGDAPTETFTYTMTDGDIVDNDPVAQTADLVITVHGLNDAPTIDLSMGTVSFVSEDAGNSNMIGVYQLDADGNPTDPEIILTDSNDATGGQTLATFGDGAELHYFLVPDASVEGGVPTFSKNASGQWEISFDGGVTTHEVRFDDADINNNPEDTFRITTDAEGRLIAVDDLMMTIDDDDFNDVIIRENDNPGTGFENTFTEDGPPVHVTGEVNISDVDSTHMSRAVVTLTNAHDADSLNIDAGALPGGITATVNGNEIVLSGDAPVSDYESAIERITFSNGSDDPDTSDRLIDVQVWDDAADPAGDPSNVATAVIHVIAVDDNTPPVAVDDTGSGSGSITGDGGVIGTVEGSAAYHLVAQEYDGQSGKWVQATLSDWGNGNGSHYGVESASGGQGNGNGGNSGDDKFIENNGNLERLLIQFDDPQESVSLKFTADGNGQESIQAWDADGNPITDLTVSESGDIVTVSSATADIGTVVVMADADDPNGSVALKEVYASTPVDHLSGTYEAAVITGNVLANDHDAQDTDYTDGPGYPAGSTELTVTGAASGDLDDLTRAEYDQHLADGDFSGDSGTFSLSDDGVGATVHGRFGDLVIAEDGSYTYTTHDGLAAGDYTESFTYQVSDTDGAVDYGVIQANATINTLVAHADLGHGAMVTDTLQSTMTYTAGATTQVDFTDHDGGDGWASVAQGLGLKVGGALYESGIPDEDLGTPDAALDSAQLVQTGSGLGLSSGDYNPFDGDTNLDYSGQIGHGLAWEFPVHVFDSSESAILDFGNGGVDEPLNVAVSLSNVSDGEDVIFTVTDTAGKVYTFHTGAAADGATITDPDGSGVTLLKNGDGEYVVQGTRIGSDGSGEVLIDTIAVTPGDGAAFLLTGLEVTAEGSWQSGTTGELILPPVTGSLFDNDYSSDNAAMTAAIVGSGVGAWGTLQIAANGDWTYTPNDNVHSITASGTTEPTVEQFTYQVTDAHGLTDTATLYVPVHVNAAATDTPTEGGDVVYGDDGGRTISGLGGNDFLYGGTGDDVIDGGAGHDYVSGGDGNDHLLGGDGNDYLFGGNGDDTLFGGAGNDVIHAGAGDDTVFVSSGHDTVSLGAGEDAVTIDPTYLTNGDGAMTVTDFNIGQGDHFVLSNLSSGVVDVTSADDSGDLILTISDVNPGGDDITVTLQGVLPPTHDAVDHQVDLSAAGDDLNTVIQHIISSGGDSS
jgi:VCBS repeat-containing protein